MLNLPFFIRHDAIPYNADKTCAIFGEWVSHFKTCADCPMYNLCANIDATEPNPSCIQYLLWWAETDEDDRAE